MMCVYLHILLDAAEETAIEAYVEQAPTVEDLLPVVACAVASSPSYARTVSTPTPNIAFARS